MIGLEFVRAEDGGDPYAVRRGVQEYLLRWPGGSYDALRITWDDELEAALAAVRDLEPTRAAEAARRLGDRLQRLLAGTQWRERAAALAGGGPVEVEVRSAAAELYRLPWELVTLESTGQPLAALPGVRLVYRWPKATAAARDPATRREGGRVLVAWSQAFGPVGHAQIVGAIAAAARAGGVAFDPAADVVEHASLARLHAALQARCAAGGEPPVIVHVLCHGAVSSGSYCLGLGTETEPDVVDAARIQQLAPFARFVRLVVLTACDAGDPGPLGSHLGSVALALHRAGFEAVVASRAPLSGRGALVASEALYQRLFGEPATVEDALAAARQRLRLATAGSDWAHLQLFSHAEPARGTRPVTVRPYRGLLRFEPQHARFFFGRDAERDEALADLAALEAAGRPRFLVVAGASGTGKSSVVLAGVVPALAARGTPSLVLRPGRDPLRALGEALAQRPAAGRFVVVVDQFEEVFTHATAGGPEDARAFARRLWRLAAEAGGPAVIVTLRVDYLGRCGELELGDGARLDRVAYDEAHRVFVAQMAPEGMRAAIDGPAARAGLVLEAGLRERLLAAIGGEPNALPLLQYTLDELWARRTDGDALTNAGLDALGGPAGALARRADAVLEAMSQEERAAARRLLVRMVAYGAAPDSGVRRQVAEAEVRPAASPGPWDSCVRALVDARLVVRSERDDGEVSLDVAHEALIRRWPRLWAWYEEDRARLAELAQLREWVEEWQRFPDNLLTGNKLGFALRLRDTLAGELGPAARDLIDRSEAAERERTAEAEARARRELARARRGLRLTLAASAVLLAALVIAGWQWRAARDAEVAALEESAQRAAAERVAQQKRSESEARRLAALADVMRGGDPAHALLLAVAAADAEAALGGERLIEEVASTLRSLLAQVPDGSKLAIEPVSATRVVWSRDGTAFAIADTRDTIRVYAGPRSGPAQTIAAADVRRLEFTPDAAGLFVAEGTRARVFVRGRAEPTLTIGCDACEPWFRGAALSPDGRLVAARTSPEGQVQVRPVDGGAALRTFAPRGDGHGALVGVEWGEGGALVLVYGDGVEVWPTYDAAAPLRVPHVGPDEVERAAISDDGRQLATIVGGRTVVWRLPPGGAPARAFEAPFAGMLRFSGDGSRLFVSEGGSGALLTDEGDLVRTFEGLDPFVEPQFSRDGVWLHVPDGHEIRFLRVDGSGPDEVLPFGDAPVAFHPDGAQVITVEGTRGVELWPLPLPRIPRTLAGLAEVDAVAYSADGAEIRAVVHPDELVRFDRSGRRLGARRLPLTIDGPDDLVEIGPGGHVLMVISHETSTSILVDLDREAPARGFAAPGLTPGTRAVAWAWAKDGSRVAVAFMDGTLIVRRTDGGDDRVLEPVDGEVEALAISDDGAWVAVAGDRLRVLPVAGAGAAVTVLEDAGDVEDLEFSPDGARLLARGRGVTALLPVSGAGDRVVLGNEILGQVRWASFSPDGAHVLLAREDGPCLLVRSDGQGEPIALPGTEIGFFQDPLFSPDGSQVALLSGVVLLPRLDGRGVPDALVAPDVVSRVVWHPDGHEMLVQDMRRGVTIHPATTAALRAEACRLAGRELTGREWVDAFPGEPRRPLCGRSE